MKGRQILALLLCILLLTGCQIGEKSDLKGEIWIYVKKNSQALQELTKQDIPREPRENKRYVNKTLGYFVPVQQIDLVSEKIVEFYCGGSGNATNSTYTGFYFSADDAPYPIVFEDQTLCETSPGVYMWQNEDGSHSVYTERIIPNWFYYHVQYY